MSFGTFFYIVYLHFFHFLKYFLLLRKRVLVTLKRIIKSVDEYMYLLGALVGKLDGCLIWAKMYGYFIC